VFSWPGRWFLCYCKAFILGHCGISTGYDQRRRATFLLPHSPSTLLTKDAFRVWFVLSLFDKCATFLQITLNDMARFCPNVCSMFYGYKYVCLFAVSLLCGDIFCEPDMTSVRRLVVCILGVCAQTMVCVSGTITLFTLNCAACICGVAVLQWLNYV